MQELTVRAAWHNGRGNSWEWELDCYMGNGFKLSKNLISSEKDPAAVSTGPRSQKAITPSDPLLFLF